jgi:hypothetical protein
MLYRFTRAGASAWVVAAFLILLQSACSSGSSVYTDSTYHFRFKMPSRWSAPTSGSTSVDPGQGYVLQFNYPFGMRIIVTAPVPGLLSIPNGKQVTKKPGCPQRCIYLHLAVSGYRGLRFVQTKVGSNWIFADYVAVNSPHHDYSLQLRAPHIGKRLDDTFGRLVRSLRIGKGE